MKTAIKEFLIDETGKLSSKKLAGFIVLFLFIMLVCVDTFSATTPGGHHPSDAVYWYVLGLITCFWGLSSYDKNNFIKNQSPK